MNLLEIEELKAGYGRQDVLHGLSFTVARGEAVAILGANGAGKSTLLKVIAGAMRSHSGDMTFDGKPLHGAASRRVRSGIVHVPEGHEVVATLTVAENLALGAFRYWPLHSRRVRNETEELVYHLFPILAERRHQTSGLLSGGQQQMLAIGRSLMAHPRLLLLDEPSLGLAPVVVDQIYDRLGELRTADLSMIIVEQNSDRAMAFCDRTFVLRLGELVRESAERQFSADELRAAYFGD